MKAINYRRPEDEKQLMHLGKAFESWDKAVLLVTLEGNIVSWNKGAQDIYGYGAEEVMGKEHSILVPSNEKDVLSEECHKIMRGEHYTQVKTTHRRNNNSRIPVSLSISPILNDADTIVAFLVQVNNLAERDQEKELFSAITQSSPIGIYIVQDGIFRYINRQFEAIIGYNMHELLSTKSWNYIHQDDRELVRANAINALKYGVYQPYEYRVVTKQGQTKWIMETVISIRYQGNRATLGNFMDITESKQLLEKTNKANTALTVMVKKLEEQRRQNAILTEMRDMLQACTTMEETAPIIMGFMKKLFPQSQGALFLLGNSRTDLESIVTWGDFPTDVKDNIFAPDACWGLRRGRAHVVEDVKTGTICPHLKHSPALPYVCLPLMAKGDILGLLHLKNDLNHESSGNDQSSVDMREVAVTLSEYLSLSIANVKLSENLSMQSIQDPQSGLYNRRFMEESLQREISRAARKKSTIGIIMSDIDHFKKFNDVYGHAAGDKIITQMGKLFRDRFRGSDIACRYGGEEFLLILPEASLENTVKCAEELREDVKKMELVFQGQTLNSITMSFGVANYPDNGTKMDELLRVADTALYKAKQEGRDRVVSG